jgi:hypothetical protein
MKKSSDSGPGLIRALDQTSVGLGSLVSRRDMGSHMCFEVESGEGFSLTALRFIWMEKIQGTHWRAIPAIIPNVAILRTCTKGRQGPIWTTCGSEDAGQAGRRADSPRIQKSIAETITGREELNQNKF